AVLIWRFRAERDHPDRSTVLGTRASVVVAVALAVVAIVLTIQSVSALVNGSRPGTSALTMLAASASLAIFTPLAWAKRQLGWRMGSQALRGDGALSAIGAATSLIALAALALYDAFGWWWADRLAALVVAAIAAAEAWHTAPRRQASR
ncbi:MAG: cation transporter, partial [Streptosporangiaceae bacterium]